MPEEPGRTNSKKTKAAALTVQTPAVTTAPSPATAKWIPQLENRASHRVAVPLTIKSTRLILDIWFQSSDCATVSASVFGACSI